MAKSAILSAAASIHALSPGGTPPYPPMSEGAMAKCAIAPSDENPGALPWAFNRRYRLRMMSRTRAAVSLGVLPTRTPAFSRASFLAWAVPDEPEMIAPA